MGCRRLSVESEKLSDDQGLAGVLLSLRCADLVGELHRTVDGGLTIFSLRSGESDGSLDTGGLALGRLQFTGHGVLGIRLETCEGHRVSDDTAFTGDGLVCVLDTSLGNFSGSGNGRIHCGLFLVVTTGGELAGELEVVLLRALHLTGSDDDVALDVGVLLVQVCLRCENRTLDGVARLGHLGGVREVPERVGGRLAVSSTKVDSHVLAADIDEQRSGCTGLDVATELELADAGEFLRGEVEDVLLAFLQPDPGLVTLHEVGGELCALREIVLARHLLDHVRRLAGALRLGVELLRDPDGSVLVEESVELVGVVAGVLGLRTVVVHLDAGLVVVVSTFRYDLQLLGGTVVILIERLAPVQVDRQRLTGNVAVGLVDLVLTGAVGPVDTALDHETSGDAGLLHDGLGGVEAELSADGDRTLRLRHDVEVTQRHDVEVTVGRQRVVGRAPRNGRSVILRHHRSSVHRGSRDHCCSKRRATDPTSLPTAIVLCGGDTHMCTQTFPDPHLVPTSVDPMYGDHSARADVDMNIGQVSND